MKFNDYLKGSFKIETKDHIYLIGNELFSSIGVDYIKHRQVPKNGIIFIGYKEKSMDDLSIVVDFIKRAEQGPYTLVIGKGDYCIDDHFAYSLPESIHRVYANNVETLHYKTVCLPMGRDFRSKVHAFERKYDIDKKDGLVYCNFSINTHPVRPGIYESLKGKDFIRFDHMGCFLEYSLSRDEYFERVSRHKFIISPRGNGIDSFRLWDSLYLGTVPIVVKSNANKCFCDLPILFLENDRQYAHLTSQFLEDSYAKILETEYDFEKLRLTYWINEIYMSEQFAAYKRASASFSIEQ